MLRGRRSKLALFVVFLGLPLLNADYCDSNTHFACKETNKCIPVQWLCDGVDDCGNRSDEENCNHFFPCEQGAFNCRDGDCIPAHLKCDGVINCDNRLDELACNEADTSHLQYPIPRTASNDSETSAEDRCAEGLFRCKNAGCISLKHVCDHEADCPLGDDELDCFNNVKNCLSNEKSCDEGRQCIQERFWCDGTKQCQDGADEAKCDENDDLRKNVPDTMVNNDTEVCGPKEHLCHESTICIDSAQLCDGTNDCPFGDDEGDFCQDCSQISCETADCENVFKETECRCPKGMAIDWFHLTCVKDDPCLHQSRSHCTQLCQPIAESNYTCDCDFGFALDFDRRHCVLDVDPHGGQIFISVGNEIYISPLEVANASSYVFFSTWAQEQSIREIAWNAKNQEMWILISSNNEWSIGTVVNGVSRTLRRGFSEISSLQYDWINGNVMFIVKDRTGPLSIRACTRNLLFCTTVVSRRNDLHTVQALALHPKNGLMCWIETHNQDSSIKCANLDGTNIRLFDRFKLHNPISLGWDTIRNDLYVGYQASGDIERINFNTRQRSLATIGNAPQAITLFNGLVYFTEPGEGVVKFARVSYDDTVNFSSVPPHFTRDSTYGAVSFAINHTIIQNDAGMAEYLDSRCPYVSVIVQVDGKPHLRCLCPDGYGRDEMNECYIKRNGSLEQDNYLDLTYMTELCSDGIACGAHGKCQIYRDGYFRAKIHCSCDHGYTGYSCELIEKSASSGGNLTLLIILAALAVLILLIVVLVSGWKYFARRRYHDRFYSSSEDNDRVSPIGPTTALYWDMSHISGYSETGETKL